MSAKKAIHQSNSPAEHSPDDSRRGPFYELPRPILERIWIERLRQKDLFRIGKIGFDCASPIVSDDRKLRVLVEELGEIAQEIDAAEFGDNKKQARLRLRTELIQVAAVAIAWLKSFEKDPQ
jgi:hypothetical protein